MSAGADPFSGFELERRIVERASRCSLTLHPSQVDAIASHARAVLSENPLLHLTSITDPDEFLERHIGESFEGAAMIDPDVEGVLIDLGSGNGYPGLPLSAARPGLRPVLLDASARKSEFLQTVVARSFPDAEAVERHVQRALDLEEFGPVRVLLNRAMGGWERLVPKLARALSPDGDILLWAGASVPEVAGRAAWKTLKIEGKRPIPGRNSSWIWHFRRN
ncbi:MAG: hypothetical protein GY716_25475 [bacterium]|nr:hypothetical protein [bacterium]